MKNSLKIENLNLNLKGVDILSNVSFECSSGDVVGFVGGNGSGKTMIFRIVSGLLKPTSGKVSWNNEFLYNDIDVLPSVGLMIENVGLYPELTLFDNIKNLTSIKGNINDDQINEVITVVGMGKSANKPFKKFSVGMKKRSVLAQAIVENPELLILDEPSSGMDESGKLMLHKAIRAATSRGAMVLISSHDVNDIETICNKVYRVEEGTISLETNR